MAKKKGFSAEEKYELILAFDSREFPEREFKSYYGVTAYAVRKWKYLFAKYGMEGLRKSKGWKYYSEELKLDAVQDYRSGNYSMMEVILKYKISSTPCWNNG
ncbi:transposase-like protein [Ammoniphilus resinae]|uniref:Transposase-like protein n=1 Tax=Ammoniphilus resinae TaxID=861532 RepID=A0ABS4GNU4_9BACL|nr:transposase-like protein [Ammoniphilus resinae]